MKKIYNVNSVYILRLSPMFLRIVKRDRTLKGKGADCDLHHSTRYEIKKILKSEMGNSSSEDNGGEHDPYMVCVFL